MLVITGGENTNKSLLAAEMLRRVASRVGVEASPGFLEMTFEKSTALSLEDFDVRKHAGVLFHGVGYLPLLNENRESFQGRLKVTKGTRSATNIYVYTYTFAQRSRQIFPARTSWPSTQTTGRRAVRT